MNPDIEGKVRLCPEGPDLPVRLLNDHAAGKVVFVVGAGISMNAGLPTFEQLVKDVAKEISGEEVPPLVNGFMERNQFDRAVSKMEHLWKNGKMKVRRSAAKILSEHHKGDTSSHKALLELSENSLGHLQLVTTNFDRVFKKLCPQGKMYEPPGLPRPVPGLWNGVVHLHGMLPEVEMQSDVLDSRLETSLTNLVFNYSDFSRAYTTDGFAARFLAELMRNYTVCFVGCSLDDEMTARVVSAIAEEQDGTMPEPEHPLWHRPEGPSARKELKAFAFVGSCAEPTEQKKEEWNLRGVTPIFYSAVSNHSALHKTLGKWAEIHKMGAEGRSHLVEEMLASPAETWTERIAENEKMIWALQEPRAALKFAEKASEGSVTRWLDILSTHFLQEITNPSNISPQDINTTGRILVEWLANHAGNPDIIGWIARQGGTLAKHLDITFSARLKDAQSSIAPEMLKLWELLLTGAFIQRGSDFELFTWKNSVKETGMTLPQRRRLIEILTPYIKVSSDTNYFGAPTSFPSMETISQYLGTSVAVAGNDYSDIEEAIRSISNIDNALSDMLDDLTYLLRDALYLLSELGKITGKQDYSRNKMPSISDHNQNRERIYGWAALIKLVRDAWIATYEADPDRAIEHLSTWQRIGYPSFRRLLLFASTYERVPADYAMNILLEDDCEWLWSSKTQRETCRLLASLPSRLTGEQKQTLESAILAGPTISEYSEEISIDDARRLDSGDIWLRLHSIIESGAPLGKSATSELKAIEEKYGWKSKTERDEFYFYTFEDGELENERSILLPSSIEEIKDSLLNSEASVPLGVGFTPSDWWDRKCQEDFPQTFAALLEVSEDYDYQEDEYGLAHKWKRAMQVWDKKSIPLNEWKQIAHMLISAPSQLFDELVLDAGSWVSEAGKEASKRQEVIDLFDRISETSRTGLSGFSNPLNQALNHPIGRATQGLVTASFVGYEAGASIDVAFMERFEKIADKSNSHLLPARTILASRTAPLFQIYPEWTERHLLPLYDWDDSEEEAGSAWWGFCWTLKYDKELMRLLKRDVLQAAFNYRQLPTDDFRSEQFWQFLNLLTFNCLQDMDYYSHEDIRPIVSNLDDSDVAHVVSTLSRYISNTADKEECWRNQILPFCKTYLPDWTNKINSLASHRFAEICLQSGSYFPEAVLELKGNFIPNWDNASLFRDLKDTDYCEIYPEAALSFINALIDEPLPLAEDLIQCVKKIIATEPDLKDTEEFKTLSLATGIVFS